MGSQTVDSWEWPHADRQLGPWFKHLPLRIGFRGSLAKTLFPSRCRRVVSKEVINKHQFQKLNTLMGRSDGCSGDYHIVMALIDAKVGFSYDDYMYFHTVGHCKKAVFFLPVWPPTLNQKPFTFITFKNCFVIKVLPMANSVFSENLCLYTFHTL